MFARQLPPTNAVERRAWVEKLSRTDGEREARVGQQAASSWCGVHVEAAGPPACLALGYLGCLVQWYLGCLVQGNLGCPVQGYLGCLVQEYLCCLVQGYLCTWGQEGGLGGALSHLDLVLPRVLLL